MSITKADHFSKKETKKEEILLLIILLLMAMPFFILAFFNHPSADDYCIASMIKNNAFWDYQKEMYNTWTGRYFANFIEALYTKNLDIVFASKLIPIALLLLLFLSVYSFVKVLFGSIISGLRVTLLSAVLFVIYLNIFPSTGEGIYWITGATEYLFANILTLFFLTCQVKLNSSEKGSRKVLLSISSILLGFMAVGLNEINLCIVLAIAVISVAYPLFFKQKFNYFNLIILICILIFCYLDISAPGNYNRAGEFSQRFGLFTSLKISAVSFAKLVGIHLQNAAFLLLTLVYIPLAVKISKESLSLKNIINFNPFFVFICSALFIFLLYFPATYSMGINPPLRVHSTIALPFIILWFFNITVLVNHFSSQGQENILFGNKIFVIIWAIIIISIATDFYKEPGQQICFRGNVFRATYDLIFRADNYNKQMVERYSQIRKAKELNNKTAEFTVLKDVPTTIFFVDISIEKNHWINSCYSQYFGLDTIALKDK
jgi:hypothetical protein